MSVDPQLRANAEAQLADVAPCAAPPRPAAELLHELQVHQIELEMQNETLRQAQAALEESRDRFVDLYDFAPVGYLTLDESCLIVEANLTGAALLGVTRKELLRRRFAAFVIPAEQERWARLFVGALRSSEKAQIDLALQRRDGGVWHARLDCLRAAVNRAAPVLRIALADITERKVIERDLAASYRRIKDLSRHMVDVQEDERRRLSGELHDRTSPNLAAIQINLGILAALPPEEAAEHGERIEDTRALVADTDASIREISAELRPPLLDYAGLGAALEGYARQFARRTGIAVKVDCVDADARLAPAVESLLFRIFQEALTNCAKHARAKSVAVTLNCACRPIVPTIADDGVGFDPAPDGSGRKGLGLLNMREMAEFAGGRCVIASQPGKGTRIEVKV